MDLQRAQIILDLIMDALVEGLCDESRLHPGNRTERKEARPLGPTKSRLGSNLTVLGFKLEFNVAELAQNSGQLAPIWAQLEPNLGGSNMAQLGRNWTQVGLGMHELPKIGPIWPTWPRTNFYQSQKTTGDRCKVSACRIEPAILRISDW